MNKTKIISINNRMKKDAKINKTEALAGVCDYNNVLYATNGYFAVKVNGNFTHIKELTFIDSTIYPINVILKAFKDFEDRPKNKIKIFSYQDMISNNKYIKLKDFYFNAEYINFALKLCGLNSIIKLGFFESNEKLLISNQEISVLILPMKKDFKYQE